MEVKDFITLDEIEPTILVPNPGDREYIVHPEISGFDKEQVASLKNKYMQNILV